MTLSVFDIFKVGIGPSSSHTMGPMRAAREFALGLKRDGLLGTTQEIAVRLYGSLAFTGVGHGTDRAILAGLEGAEPESVDPDSIEPTVQRIRTSGRIRLAGEHEIAFDEPMQLLFMHHERLPGHSNGMRFTALGSDRRRLREERSEEHTSELQSPCNLVCRLLLEKKKIQVTTGASPRSLVAICGLTVLDFAIRFIRRLVIVRSLPALESRM